MTQAALIRCFMFSKKEIGNFGEKIAKQYYEKKGYKIVAQNFWSLYGEIDLVVEKNSEITLVEVKTRRSQNYGWAEESISKKKIQNILHSYEALRRKNKLANYSRLEVLIVYIERGKAKIRRLEI